MDIFLIINNLIEFLLNYQILIYLILFFGSFFEIIIGFSFSAYGKIFFILGSILAGMGILNIWLVILIFYFGNFLGDNLSYFLGKKYKSNLYMHILNKGFLKKYINEINYVKGLKFYKKYKKHSIFFSKFLSSPYKIIPFIAGIYKINYKIFFKYNLSATILNIGQFIIIGYFIGIYYKFILLLFFKYAFVLLYIILVLIYLYTYIKRKKYILEFKEKWFFNKKKLLILIIKHLTSIIITITILFLFFLFYLSFIHKTKFHSTNTPINKTLLLNNTYLNNCKNLNTYYLDSNSNIIQPINIIFVTNKKISNILGNNWIKINIFEKKEFSFKDFITSIKDKTLPVSNLYMNNLSQNSAYQYKNNSIIKREHIRFWNFIDKNNSNQKIYLGSISEDNGITLEFYNYFLTPVHEINQNIDKSRDFLYHYLSTQRNIKCQYIPTNCYIKKARKEKEDQQYYTDGKILFCNIK